MMELAKNLTSLLLLCFSSFSFAQTSQDYVYSGDVWVKKGKYEGAIKTYSKAIELDSMNAAAYSKRGYAKFDLNNRSDSVYDNGAKEDFEKAISLDTSESYYFRMEAFIGLGDCRSQLLDYDGALQAYGQAMELNPKYKKAFYHRGNVKYKLGNKTGACADWKSAKRIASRKYKEHCK